MPGIQDLLGQKKTWMPARQRRFARLSTGDAQASLYLDKPRLLRLGRLRGAAGTVVDRLTIGIAELSAVRQLHRQELAAVRTVLERMNRQRDRHSGRQRLRSPALSNQAARAVHLDGPRLRHSI